MSFVDVIAKKRDGHALSRDDIHRFVTGVTSGTVPDYQASALLMAIVLRGMTDEETAWLTDAMARSGDRVDLSDIPGVKVGKHSTGGVGDKVRSSRPSRCRMRVVGPDSGRGLGTRAGRLKAGTIPGFGSPTIDGSRGAARACTSSSGRPGRLRPDKPCMHARRHRDSDISADFRVDHE